MRALKLPGFDYWKVALHEFSINPGTKSIPADLDLVTGLDYLNKIEKHMVYDFHIGSQHKMTEAFSIELNNINKSRSINMNVGTTFELITKEAPVIQLPYIFESGVYIYGYLFRVDVYDANSEHVVDDYICVPSQMECDLINIMNI